MSREFHVDRTEPLPIHVQLSEQLRYHIEGGTWQPGYRLPTVRFLAGSLGINYNTVRAVYGDLEREGYLTSEQGRGTFVASRPPRPRDQRYRVETLIDGVLMDADRLGVSAVEFSRLAYLRAKLFRRSVPAVPLLFVECCRAEVEFHAREIEEATHARATGVVLEDLKTLPPPYFERFPLIATTLFHVGAVQKAVGPRWRVLGLLVEPSPSEVVAQLRPLPKGSRVALVCSTRPAARKIQNALQRTGLTHLSYWLVPYDSPEEVERAFREADEVYISRRILAQHKGRWPTRRVFHEYTDVLDGAALQLLRGEMAKIAQTRSSPLAAGARGQARGLGRIARRNSKQRGAPMTRPGRVAGVGS